ELRARAGIIAGYEAGGNLQGANCARNCAREPASNVLKVGRACDVVSVEDATRAMPGDLHGHAFGHSGVDHVPDSCATQIVSQPTGHTDLATRGRPRFAIVPASYSHIPAPKVREQERDHALLLPLEGLHPVHLAGDETLQVRGHVYEAPVVVLCGA